MHNSTPSLALEVKNLDEAGYIEGVAAAYGNIDFGNDRILPGAATKSLEGKSSLPMLLFHDHKRPVGKWGKMVDTQEGLLVEGKISTKTREGGEAYELVKDGALGGLSIGYRNPRGQVKGSVREISSLDVHEVSLVTIAMNPLTSITSVKDIAGSGELPTLPQFEEFLREAGFSKTQATAIAGKGLSHLLRSESGGDQNAADFWAALRA